MVCVDCCRCIDGILMDTDIYATCFNCGHDLCFDCPRAILPETTSRPSASQSQRMQPAIREATTSSARSSIDSISSFVQIPLTHMTDVPEDEESSSDESIALSVFSDTSSVSSLGGYEAFHLPEQFATFLLRDKELCFFYEKALSLTGKEAFAKKHDRLLKRYISDLKLQKKTALHRQAVRLLGESKQRGDVTNWVIQSVTATEHGLDKLKQQSAAGNRKMVEHYPQLVGTRGSPHETDSEDSGEGDDPSSDGGDDEEQPPPVFESLVEGAAFEAYKARISCLVDPPSGIAAALAAQSLDTLAALLEQRFTEVATDEYEWIRDLRDAGLRRREIAEVLYSSAYDKPWIFYAPDSSLVEKWATTRTDFHFEGCPHLLQSQASKDKSSGSVAESAKSVPHVQYTELQRHIEELCGLGGIKSNTRHQTAWNGRVQFRQSCVAAISYSFGDPEHPELDTPLQTAHRLHKMSRSLLAAMALLQETRSCCNSFTTLNLVEEPTEQRRRLQLCNVSFHWATVFEHCCQKTVGSLTGKEEATPDLMLLGAWSASLLSKLHLSDVIPTSQESAFSVMAQLHVASVAMQLVCVGLLSYAQAHIGSLRPFFLDCRIDETVLLGLHTTSQAPDEARQIHIRSHLVSLSCLGEMTKDKVMIFSLSNRSENLDAEWQFDIFGAPEDIMDTWGPGQIICRQDSNNTPVAMVLANGFIGPVRSDNGAVTYHWDHQLNMPSDAPDLNMRDMIAVGTFIKVNQQCCSQVQTSLRWEQTENWLFDLGTGYTFWETVEQQVGLQAGYHVIGQANWTKAKRPGTSIKQVRLQQPIDDLDLIDFLGCPWGVRVSHCTGVSQRVLLRHLAGDLLPIFAQAETNADHIQNWNLLKDPHKVFENLRNETGAENFREWLQDLPPNLYEFLLRTIRKLLLKVANTGLSSDRRFFSIAWISPSSLSSCIRIPLEHDHAKWLQMLEDSGDCATFAYMSDTCLEAGGISCQGSGWKWKHQIPMLETAVHCPEQQSQWTLTHGQVYFFRHLNRDLFWVKAETNALNTRLPATTTRLIRSNNVPAHIANRLAERFREKKGRRICEKRLVTTRNSQVAVVVSSR